MAVLSLRAIPSSSIALYFLAAPSFTAASQALEIFWLFALTESLIIGALIPCLIAASMRNRGSISSSLRNLTSGLFLFKPVYSQSYLFFINGRCWEIGVLSFEHPSRRIGMYFDQKEYAQRKKDSFFLLPGRRIEKETNKKKVVL